MINLSIQSGNVKNIDLIYLDNFSVGESFLSNETINTSYNNYIIKISTSDTSFNMINFWNNIDSTYQNIIFIVILISLLMAALLFINMLKRM